VDAPHKIDQEPKNAASKPIMRLERLMDKAKHELIIISSYFVPNPSVVTWLPSLVKRGVEVKIVTNSLASTDVVAVHTGYRRYREELVTHGVELYEMKPTGEKRPRQRLIGSSTPATARLHAKAYVVDRKDVMIGSFNLDPRSVSLNTELALVIHSPELAAQVIAIYDELTRQENSYQVASAEDGGLVWKTVEDKKEVKYTHEPEAGIWRNIEVNLMSLLPLEEHL
jgi:putative cardiolipin synthase